MKFVQIGSIPCLMHTGTCITYFTMASYIYHWILFGFHRIWYCFHVELSNWETFAISEVRSVLNMAWTTSMQNFHLFLSYWRSYVSWKEKVQILLILGTIFAKILEYISKCKKHVCFMPQSNIKCNYWKLYNPNKIFIAAILKNTCHYP